MTAQCYDGYNELGQTALDTMKKIDFKWNSHLVGILLA